MDDLFAPSAIEVVREGRFQWQVVTRYPDGMDMSMSSPFMFRWSAERYARKKADAHRPAGQPQVVSRIDLGIEREIGGLMDDVIAAHNELYHPGRDCPDDGMDECSVRAEREKRP